MRLPSPTKCIAIFLLTLIVPGIFAYMTQPRRDARSQCLRFIELWSKEPITPLKPHTWPAYEYKPHMWLVQASYRRSETVGQQWCNLREQHRGRFQVLTLTNRYDDIKQLMEQQ